jgi:hypothetical protein
MSLRLKRVSELLQCLEQVSSVIAVAAPPRAWQLESHHLKLGHVYVIVWMNRLASTLLAENLPRPRFAITSFAFMLVDVPLPV